MWEGENRLQGLDAGGSMASGIAPSQALLLTALSQGTIHTYEVRGYATSGYLTTQNGALSQQNRSNLRPCLRGVSSPVKEQPQRANNQSEGGRAGATVVVRER